MSKQWFVFVDDFNHRHIEKFNIFDHHFFSKGCDKIFKDNKDNKEVFAEEIRRELMYYFWSKCEWEVIVKSMFYDNDKKIDVYQQVMLNYDSFINYLWNYYTNNKKK